MSDLWGSALESLLSARHGEGFDATRSGLDAVRTAPLNGSVLQTAEGAMRTRSSLGRYTPDPDRRLPRRRRGTEINATVLHYDADYELLAEVMDFESAWLSPRGSLP